MRLPFSEQEFLEVFAAYNRALWPGALALWCASVVVLALVLRGARHDRAVSLLLAVHWAWAGIAYHFAYFATVNPAALLFGAMFLVEAVLYAREGLRSEPPRYSFGPTAAQRIGMGLAVYALAYPALSLVFVGRYPHTPTFGVPCPTTLFTLGLFLMSAPARWRLAVVPIIWAAIGGSAALLFGVVTDFVLLAAGPLVLFVLVARRFRHRRGSS